jgi:hypothetical protein
MTSDHEQSGPPYHPKPFTQPLPVAIATMALIALLLLLWYTFEVLLLVFAAVLVAVFPRSLSAGLSHYTPLRGNGACWWWGSRS